MAIYHFTAKVVTRSGGRSVVSAAAYRAGERLKEHRTGLTYDFTHKRGVEHSEIHAPENTPDWAHDRSQLWNAVDQVERRRDAQLARDLEIALPVELSATAQVDLLRDFVRHSFVAHGMVADMAVHRDNPKNPHAHVLLTLRHIDKTGFGLKERSWNTRATLQSWRIGWADTANEHLERAGLSVRIDHRTLEAQQLELFPGRKIGVSRERQRAPCLPFRIAERISEQSEIARANGARILANPKIAIKALSHYQTSFTEFDIATFLHTRTDGGDQFGDAYMKVTTSPELVILGRDERGNQRFASRNMLELRQPSELAVDAPKLAASAMMTDIDAVQQRAAERWRDKQLERSSKAAASPRVQVERPRDLAPSSPSKDAPQHRCEHTYKGPEDDFSI